jgi:hypothetical protein
MVRTDCKARIENPLTGQFIWKTMVADPAVAVDPTKPPSVDRVPGSKPYFGHPVLEGTRFDGWCFGVVTDPFEADCDQGCTIGDAFVEAPDGSRAGLVWMVDDDRRFAVLSEPDSARWGVFLFAVAQPINSMAQLVDAFALMLPTFQMLHARYRSQPTDDSDHPQLPS